MSPTVYLITGASRGIGFALTTVLAARPNTVVFAGARNPSGASELQALAKSLPDRIHVVKLDSTDVEAHNTAVEQIKKEVGRLDVVIANAGACNTWASILDTTPDQTKFHFDVNVLGPQILFQATYPLLKASTPAPKFVIITSASGSLTISPPMSVPNGAYGMSKAAVNYLARMLHFENEGLVCFPVHPGLVSTEPVKRLMEIEPRMKDFPAISPEESATALVKIIEESTREKTGGEFIGYDGSKLPW